MDTDFGLGGLGGRRAVADGEVERGSELSVPVSVKRLKNDWDIFGL
jgi:hypothetical protein